MVSEDQLTFLRSIDTPTVCNLIEIVAPARRGAGYTTSHLHCPFPDLPPMVGFAKTATIRARDPVSGPSYLQKRLDYLDYVAAAPRPSIVAIQDKDEPPGYGAFWGEVQTNVHKALGCLGTVTNGSIRDLAAVAEGFQMLAGSIAPSHAYVRVVEFGISVTIHSMEVRSGDLIHADRHGAVVVPEQSIDAIKASGAGVVSHSSGLIPIFEEPRSVTGVRVVVGILVTRGIAMRTFFSDTTKIDVIAQISGDDLEVDRLVLRRFEGSETTATAAFQKLVARYCGRPLAEYAVAPSEVALG